MARLWLYFRRMFVFRKISFNCLLFEFLSLLGMRCNFLRKRIFVIQLYYLLAQVSFWCADVIEETSKESTRRILLYILNYVIHLAQAEPFATFHGMSQHCQWDSNLQVYNVVSPKLFFLGGGKLLILSPKLVKSGFNLCSGVRNWQKSQSPISWGGGWLCFLWDIWWQFGVKYRNKTTFFSCCVDHLSRTNQYRQRTNIYRSTSHSRTGQNCSIYLQFDWKGSERLVQTYICLLQKGWVLFGHLRNVSATVAGISVTHVNLTGLPSAFKKEATIVAWNYTETWLRCAK